MNVLPHALVATEVARLRAGRPVRLPFFLSRVPAGWPSPADDYVERRLDLNELLVRRPESTYFVRVEGESMIEAGIYAGDVLVVDRAEEARPGDVVVAALDGELTVKRLERHEGRLYLVAENGAYPPIEVRTELTIWGVVRHVVRTIR